MIQPLEIYAYLCHEDRREVEWCRAAWQTLQPKIPPLLPLPIQLYVGPKLPPDVTEGRAFIFYFTGAYRVWVCTKSGFPSFRQKANVQHFFAHEMGHAIILDAKGGREWMDKLAADHPEERARIAKYAIPNGHAGAKRAEEILCWVLAEVFFPVWK
jgi:hypothetical protein